MSERDASGDGPTGGVSGSPEEAVWRDLISRFGQPADRTGSVPWPEREDLPDDTPAPPGADSTSPADSGPAAAAESTDATQTNEGGQDTDGSTGSGAWFSRTRVIRPATPPASPAASTPAPQAPPPPGARGRNQVPAGPHGDGYAGQGQPDEADDPDDRDDPDDHYIPPPPPPLPHLDPVAKGAWAALFGGPAYLLISTLIGMSAPGWAALLAVAAFIGGFAVVVLRLGDKPSRGDGPDNGAVV